ncbi:MAG: IS1380 family transposase [Lentisphaerae bacterium]|nr:IS1380 family transposase [Lentisphaerota bacterium]
MNNPQHSDSHGAHQSVSVEISTAKGNETIRLGFTDQRLTAYGGMAVWSQFLQKKGFRERLAAVLPQQPTSPNAYAPTDIGLGFVGGILCGADKLSRVAWLAQDAAVASVLGIEGVPSQSTLTRFFRVFDQPTNDRLNALNRWVAGQWPSSGREGYTLDVDSSALLHEDGHQEGVEIGYTRTGLKPCHRPLVGVIAELKVVAQYWLRRGDSACSNHAAEFIGQCMDRLPAHLRIGLVRGDSGFCTHAVRAAVRKRGAHYILVASLNRQIQTLCRHADRHWTATAIEGVEVQEVAGGVGERLIVIRQRITQRPESGGKVLVEVPGYRFQALVTSLPDRVTALDVWRRYNGRADSENRLKELGRQFGVRGLCCQRFWATEAAHLLAILAYNLCVLLQRELGKLERMELTTLRMRLFLRAGVWSRAQGRPTLKLAVPQAMRAWWLAIIDKLRSPLPPFNQYCNAVEQLHA